MLHLDARIAQKFAQRADTLFDQGRVEGAGCNRRLDARHDLVGIASDGTRDLLHEPGVAENVEEGLVLAWSQRDLAVTEQVAQVADEATDRRERLRRSLWRALSALRLSPRFGATPVSVKLKRRSIGKT